jgi:hypothetical protein
MDIVTMVVAFVVLLLVGYVAYTQYKLINP